jgi:hypothetical protein
VEVRLGIELAKRCKCDIHVAMSVLIHTLEVSWTCTLISYCFTTQRNFHTLSKFLRRSIILPVTSSWERPALAE